MLPWLDLTGGEHLAGPAMGEESLSQERWRSERLPLVCSPKIVCCVVVVEVLKLAVVQGGTDSPVAFAWVSSWGIRILIEVSAAP